MLFDLFVFRKQIESTSLVMKAFYLDNFGHNYSVILNAYKLNVKVGYFFSLKET